MEGMTTVSTSLRRTAAFLAFALLLGAVPCPAAVQRPPTADAAAVLTQLTRAWEAEDHESLAALLDGDGAEVTLQRRTRANVRTSPAQAHYLFKSLFQGTGDHVLAVESLTEKDAVAHAVLDWRYRRGESRLRERVFVSLVRGAEGWRVDGLRTGH